MNSNANPDKKPDDKSVAWDINEDPPGPVPDKGGRDVEGKGKALDINEDSTADD